MDIIINRFDKTENYTVSRLEILDTFNCFILEDAERPEKIKHQTCIPAGRYEVIINYSPKFKQFLPLLLNVPNFEGIRIHKGNTIAHTSGCLLPNLVYEGKGIMRYSEAATSVLINLIDEALKRGEQVFVNIS